MGDLTYFAKKTICVWLYPQCIPPYNPEKG